MFDPMGGLDRIQDYFLSYIETAFRIDNPETAAARRLLLESHGTLALDPIIEMVPRYQRWPQGLEALVGPEGEASLGHMSEKPREAFIELALSGLFPGAPTPSSKLRLAGKYRPYDHQIRMLGRGTQDGLPGIITSGTGSGKTESFMLPLLASIVQEASTWPSGVRTGNTWFNGGRNFVPQRAGEPENRPKAIRALILYPMNALVEDQMVRLRRALDSEAAHATMDARLKGNRIFFGRYTGGTPVTGFSRHPRLHDDEGWKARRKRQLRKLRDEMAEFARMQDSVRKHDDMRLKADPDAEPNRYLFPSLDGSELVSRWDMQATPPDVLVTNYSMLNAILVREVDAPMLDLTRTWIETHGDARFHLVMDELHLVRGSGGAEIAGLLRMLFRRLGLDDPRHRHKLRVLASSASLPVEGQEGEASMRFLWDMFGAAGTHADVGATGAKGPRDWRSAVVSGTPLPPQAVDSPIDAELLSELGLAVEEGAHSDRFGRALVAAVDHMGGSAQAGAQRTEKAVQTAAAHLGSACSRGPVQFADAAGAVFGTNDRDALRGLMVVRALAEVSDRVQGITPPAKAGLEDLPSFRLHAFFRSIEGLFASVRPGAGGPTWGTPSVERGEAFDPDVVGGNRLRRFEALYCESCGELFAGGRRGGEKDGRSVSLLPAPQDLERLPESATSGRFEEASYEDLAVFWPTTSNTAVEDDPAYRWDRAFLDPSTGFVTADPGRTAVGGFLLRRRFPTETLDQHRRSGRAASTAVPYSCPRCRTDYSPRYRAANTRRREGRLSPIRSFRTGFGKTSQLLASEFTATLKAQGGDGKLVAFSDSRQDAASLALNIEVQHQRDLHRDLLVAAAYDKRDAQKHDPVELQKLEEEWKAAFVADDLDAQQEILPKLRSARNRAKLVNQRTGIPLSTLLEFERDAPTEGRLRPVLQQLVSLGANPNSGPDHGTLAGRRWPKLFEMVDGSFRWRSDGNDKDLAGIRNAKDHVLNSQRPDATDLLFSRTYFAIEETGLGWPSFFGEQPYGEAESRLDAWLRVFSDAYRILPNRFMQEADAPPWDKLGDTSARVVRLLAKLSDRAEDEFADFIQWLSTSPRVHRSGRIDVAQLFIRPADPDGSYWRCGMCSRVHLHRGFGRCTRCGEALDVAQTGTVRGLLAENFLGARHARARERGEAPFRLRCEELTGQSSENGQRLRRFKGITVREEGESESDYRLRAQADEIDFVSVTTTMEVGVDIGALEAVYQANMPPQRFNYQQRVGRAGRRGQAFATVLTVCRSRSHDLHYFRNPLRITGDRPPPPFLTTGLTDIPSRLLRKFWLTAAFDRLRRSSGDVWAGDDVVPPDIHGEFIYCSDFFAEGSDWPSRLHGALAMTDGDRRRDAGILAQAGGIDVTILLAAVDVASVIRDLGALRDEFNGRQIGLASAMAERGLLPLYGMPTRSRNLYVGMRTRRQGDTDDPEWDTIDRDQDVAIFEFAPGAILVREKRRHLCVGFVGELPPPDRNPTNNDVVPYDGWARETFYVGFCEACGSWEKDKEGMRPCSACGATIPQDSYRPCISPAGYRTDFRPKDEDGPTSGRRDMVIGSVGPNPMVRVAGNLRLLFEERAQVHRINSGPLDEAGEPRGFIVEERVDRFAGNWAPKRGDVRRRTVRITCQAVAPDLVADDVGRWPNKGDTEPVQGWLASSKTTNSLYLTPATTSPLLRLADLDAATGRDPDKTSVRAAAVSATQILLLRAALELDVSPEEFDALPPRVQGKNGNARPFLQIADTLVNGSGFCRHLHSGGRVSIDTIIDSVLNDAGTWPLSAAIHGDHRATCDQACYRCLQRYGNRSLHGLLDWRLGLTYLRGLRNPEYVCGLDGQFDVNMETSDWLELANRYVGELEAYVPGLPIRIAGRLGLPSFPLDGESRRWAVVVHPLWNRSGLAVRLGIDEHLAFVDTFELARRPLAALERLRKR